MSSTTDAQIRPTFHFDQALASVKNQVAKMFQMLYPGTPMGEALESADPLILRIRDTVRDDQNHLIALYAFLANIRKDVAGQLADSIDRLLKDPRPTIQGIYQRIADEGAVKELRRTAAKIDKEFGTFSDERGVSPELGQRLNVTALRLYRRAVKIERGEAHAGSE